MNTVHTERRGLAAVAVFALAVLAVFMGIIALMTSSVTAAATAGAAAAFAVHLANEHRRRGESVFESLEALFREGLEAVFGKINLGAQPMAFASETNDAIFKTAHTRHTTNHRTRRRPAESAINVNRTLVDTSGHTEHYAEMAAEEFQAAA